MDAVTPTEGKPHPSGLRNAFRYIEFGAKLHPLETLLAAFFAILVFLWSPEPLRSFFVWNGITQLVLFIVVVQIPLFVTGHMVYVDIGWPCGLVLLGVNGLLMGDGYSVRRYIMCGCFLLHGLRMAIGGIILFGQMSKFTYRFKDDLPRYKYARLRWSAVHGMPDSTWWLKAQHDTLQQCYANSVVLACPLALTVYNTQPSLGVVEVTGWAVWGVAWLWENVADVQKTAFLQVCKRQGKQASTSEKEKETLKTSVLGHAPWDGKAYHLWTLCRHPNYFGEWMAWVGFGVVGLSSIGSIDSFPLSLAFVGLLAFLPRVFYDCLLHWTGAAPAEYFSSQKRPSYRQYQEQTRCFFPFNVPFVDHFRVAGWPSQDHDHSS